MGSQPRARMATPFHDFWPRQTAPYPACSMAARGNSESVALSSCRQTTSGSAVRSQSRRLASRLFTLLMLKVAIFIRQPVSHTIGPQGGDLTENRQAFDQPSGEDR